MAKPKSRSAAEGPANFDQTLIELGWRPKTFAANVLGVVAQAKRWLESAEGKESSDAAVANKAVVEFGEKILDMAPNRDPDLLAALILGFKFGLSFSESQRAMTAEGGAIHVGQFSDRKSTIPDIMRAVAEKIVKDKMNLESACRAVGGKKWARVRLVWYAKANNKQAYLDEARKPTSTTKETTTDGTNSA